MIRNKRIGCLSLAIFFSAILGQGCTLIWSEDRSVLRSLPSMTDSVTVDLDSVTIAVLPKNHKFFAFIGPLVPVIPIWHSEAESRFWFLLQLSPKIGEITFHPNSIALATDQGDTIHLAGMSGPVLISGFRNYPLFYDKSLAIKGLNDSVIPMTISEKVIVGLMFDTETLGPDRHFTLVLTGLERQEHPIEVPPLKFKKSLKMGFDFGLFDPLNFRKEWVVEQVEDEAPRTP